MARRLARGDVHLKFAQERPHEETIYKYICIVINKP